jgi:hypothetical protein
MDDAGTSMKMKCTNNTNNNSMEGIGKSNNNSGNGTSNVRASTIYDICHPLVM